MSYSEEFIDFIATIKGEAGICGDISKRAVAHCIMNRIGFGEWAQHISIMGYLKNDDPSQNNGQIVPLKLT